MTQCCSQVYKMLVEDKLFSTLGDNDLFHCKWFEKNLFCYWVEFWLKTKEVEFISSVPIHFYKNFFERYDTEIYQNNSGQMNENLENCSGVFFWGNSIDKNINLLVRLRNNYSFKMFFHYSISFWYVWQDAEKFSA